MLPRPLRVRRSAEHRAVTRSGRRGTTGALTVHVLPPGVPATAPPVPTSGDPAVPARAGLVVGKVVGDAVVRHRVSRRLRHLLADRLRKMPAGTLVVVRAGPGAGTADLAVDLDGALRRASRPRRAGRRVPVEVPSGGSRS